MTEPTRTSALLRRTVPAAGANGVRRVVGPTSRGACRRCLVNTGWTCRAYGTGSSRFALKYTRAFVTAILDGTLRSVEYIEDPIFGLSMPKSAPNVPSDILHPRSTPEADTDAYDAATLGLTFRENDVTYELSDEVRAAGPEDRPTRP